MHLKILRLQSSLKFSGLHLPVKGQHDFLDQEQFSPLLCKKIHTPLTIHSPPYPWTIDQNPFESQYKLARGELTLLREKKNYIQRNCKNQPTCTRECQEGTIGLDSEAVEAGEVEHKVGQGTAYKYGSTLL